MNAEIINLKTGKVFYKGHTFCQYTNNAGTYLHNTDTFMKDGLVDDPKDQPIVKGGNPGNGWILVKEWTKESLTNMDFLESLLSKYAPASP